MRMSHINFNHLYYFWQVCKAGSVVGAAEALFLTPQTITGQIKALEERLEFVEGRRLKRCAETGTWNEAARWLGRTHRTFSGHGSLAALPAYDADFYLSWAQRALESACRVSQDAAGQLRRIVSSYDKVAGPLGEAEPTLLHGEFYCTNILVQDRQDGVRICPFDWETAAAGCGALDLAYLLRQRLGGDDVRTAASRQQSRRDDGHGKRNAPNAGHRRNLKKSRKVPLRIGDAPERATEEQKKIVRGKGKQHHQRYHGN